MLVHSYAGTIRSADTLVSESGPCRIIHTICHITSLLPCYLFECNLIVQKNRRAISLILLVFRFRWTEPDMILLSMKGWIKRHL